MSQNILAEIAMPTSLYRGAQIRRLEALAIDSGIAGIELMTRAGQAAFQYLEDRWPEKAPIEIFCGGGNNGGDGYVLAALVAESGVPVKVWAMTDNVKGDALSARQWAERQGVEIQPWQGATLSPQSLVVDALLGIGLSGSLRQEYAEVIAMINASGAPVLAIDIPSGLCCDTGRTLGDAIHATATLTFVGLKQGLYTGEAVDYVGDLLLNQIDLPGELYKQIEPASYRVSPVKLMASLGTRSKLSHKGSFGHVLVIGGDKGMAGAVLLAASAAARSGAGLVSCATRAEHLPAFCAARPEVMALGVESGVDLAPLLARCSVVVIGPGLGTDAWGAELLKAALAANKPTLLDADALNLLAQDPSLNVSADTCRVLTPHPGEAGRLLGESTEAIQHDRFTAVAKLQERYQATVLLKGPGTLIAGAGIVGRGIADAGMTGAGNEDAGNEDAAIFVSQGGNPGMASGGMGDILSGVIGALMAQGMKGTEASCLGASLHAQAGDIAAELGGERGLLAMDVVDKLQMVVNGRSLESR
ncbi:yjeF-like protein, hydroxyethylthiazole kinase-related [Spongiibacter sp. IMCC21906]|uniref:NAD(P)H-hydrate dehydratase n=1 Tax=Spongiibacter sp. IMCC21906 TaxID=1620392 RepID=UPI00062DE333|nr:NAD(P)H-hydrate dehydratase [Spongiibacter sp. IMCC21906]AKH70721.1 yjeF-like protein, hydroxyethylthiazole kinase-related [Spongiibacter sp. IMCC21906]